MICDCPLTSIKSIILTIKGPFINNDLGGRQIVCVNAANLSVPPYANCAKIGVPPCADAWKIWVPPTTSDSEWAFPSVYIVILKT